MLAAQRGLVAVLSSVALALRHIESGVLETEAWLTSLKNTVTDDTFGGKCFVVYGLITCAMRLPISRLPFKDGWIISAP